MPIPWLSCQPEPCSQTQGRDDSHNKALQEASEVHQWALDAAHMLEKNIEGLTAPDAGTPTAALRVGSRIGVYSSQAPIGQRDM